MLTGLPHSNPPLLLLSGKPPMGHANPPVAAVSVEYSVRASGGANGLDDSGQQSTAASKRRWTRGGTRAMKKRKHVGMGMVEAPLSAYTLR